MKAAAAAAAAAAKTERAARNAARIEAGNTRGSLGLTASVFGGGMAVLSAVAPAVQGVGLAIYAI